MFYILCGLTNTMHPTNTSKIWNCDPNIRYRTETVTGHFKKVTDTQTIQKIL